MSNPEHWFLNGGGTCGALARSIDWNKSILGPPDQWPTALKSTLATMFQTRQPMFLWWGPELIQFYNDAYLPSFGRGKHPLAMGQRGRECWREIWNIIGPQIDDVMNFGKASWNEDALVPILRNGRFEEVYWTYGYTPLFGDTGQVVGTLVICTETTNRVVGERRTRTLYDLINVTSSAKSIDELSSGLFEVLERAREDVPFAVLCEQEASGELTRVLRAVGVDPERAEVLRENNRLRLVQEGSGPFPLEGSETTSPAGMPVEASYLAPCPTEALDPRCAFLFGLNPALMLDDHYRRFLDQVAAHLGIAKSRLLETSRRESIERERQNLLDQAPFATAVLTGPKFLFESANAKYHQMVGRRDIIGRSYLEVFPDPEGGSTHQQVQRAYDTGKSLSLHEVPLWIDRGNGAPEECYFNVTLEPIRDLYGRVAGMMLVGLDITEQVLSRRVLEKANAEREGLLESLREANQAKDDFLAILGHELRNPLAPILTALRLIRERGSNQNAREHNIIERQAHHLIRLVDDLLDVSKIAHGKVELRCELVDLREVAQKAVEMAGDLLEQRQHHLALHLGDQEAVCHGDPVRLAQIITNLLTNAARYTEPGGQIELRLRKDQDRVFVSVRDNGIGISEEMLPLVFGLFKQAKRSSDRSEGGLGIGLTLVHNLTTLHGGTVSAHSSGLGKGSEFVVVLPLANDVDAARAKSSPQLVDVSTSPKRILLVDDNVDAVELLEQLLVMKGHLVAAVTDPLVALDRAADFLPEVAVLDLGLPVVDGYELARRLRMVEGCEGCRLVALSGYGSLEDRRRGAEVGFEEHLVKPVDFERLLLVLDGPSPRSRA